MGSKKIFAAIFSIFLAALIICSLFLSFLNEESPSAIRFCIQGMSLATLIFAVVYVLKGARKVDAVWFVLFKLALAATYYLTLLRGITAGRNVFGCAISALSFGLVCMLIIAKDLGKMNSLILSIAVALLQVGSFLSSLNHFSVTRLMSTVINIAFAFVLFSLTELKYIDKAERNTK